MTFRFRYGHTLRICRTHHAQCSDIVQVEFHRRRWYIFLNLSLSCADADDFTTAWLQAFDARAVAVQGNLVITTPNAHFVPEFHHFEEEDVQARADGRFGVIDCFQWPQAYDDAFCHSVCIPRKEAFPFPHPLHWAWFTPSQDDLKLIPGNSFPVGTLAPDKVDGLRSLLELVNKRVRDYRNDHPGRGQTVYSRLLCLRHALARLKSHPLTFRDLLIFVTDAQRLFLDIYSYMDWVLIAQPRTTLGIRHDVNVEWMGGFAQSSDICNMLFNAGVPVWYVRANAYISPDMKVVEPVLLTRPDHIIISMYAEGRKIRPFEVIYRGVGGRNRHINIRRMYAGTTYQEPGPAKSSQPSSSSSRPASGPKSSTLGKAPKQKGKQRHQPCKYPFFFVYVAYSRNFQTQLMLALPSQVNLGINGKTLRRLTFHRRTCVGRPP